MPSPRSRLAWIDWMRGLACLLMFQTHCYDAWLGGDARKTTFLMYSQLLGTFPAPLFLFLAGISFALVTDKLVRKEVSAGEITRKMLRRGSEIFAFGLLFRLQEYLISWGWAPWTDLFRVDILNTIGISMILMALVCGITLHLANPQRRRSALIATGVLVAALIALLTPPLWTNWRPSRLPWPIESYINGVHNLGTPQPWLFPIFPWTAFAFVGLAAGFILFSDWARDHSSRTLALFAVAGVGMFAVSRWLDHTPMQTYSVYDYWHTSPNFFLLRVGFLLVIAFLSYAWCRWGFGTRGFSPLIQLGQTSLLVYWVHIEFVYGRFSILSRRANNIRTASIGLLAIFLMMLALSMLRTRVDWRGMFNKSSPN
ncbi:MAG TPA: heparan-alpha-glucosaminide N-acetyltransferase domain-containing protein [Terriglobales bacterium]|nr:heparan-alpha-glucosaminide N-acetyltransferase domain-containing protein [Terriglobales bacterium]